MKTLTLSRKSLTDLSHQLLSIIHQDSTTIDMIIGIATGGIYVSQPIYEELQKQQWEGTYTEVKLSRSSTEKKESLGVESILTKLPYPLLNLLRTIEVKYFETFKSNDYDDTIEERVRFNDTQINDIKQSKTLLLIDDAIDTGSTIMALKNVIQKINPTITVKVAVLTVTHNKPYIEPDYTLYKKVLLRCPWAMDYKGKDKID